MENFDSKYISQNNQTSNMSFTAAVIGDYFGKHKPELVYYPEAESQYYAVNYI